MFIEIAIGLLGMLIGAMLTYLYYDNRSAPEAAPDKTEVGFDEPDYDHEIGIDEYLPYDEEGTWIEVEIQNDCGYGCKIYQHNRTGRRVLAHNSSYGCKRSFNLIKE